jgi:hypothetical protein
LFVLLFVTMAQISRYYSFIAPTSWFHQASITHPYPLNQTFTRAELEEITPTVLLEFFNQMCYGDPYPAGGVRALVRSSTVEQYKKCISHFMPNQEHQWRHGLGGNPTQSRVLNDLITELKR